MAIQKAAAAALRRPGDSRRACATKYRRRLEKLVAALKQVGFECDDAGRHVLPLRAGAEGAAATATFANAEEASQFLIHEQSICSVPWDDAGRVPALLGDVHREGRGAKRTR